jgi:hypothetical protein
MDGANKLTSNLRPRTRFGKERVGTRTRRQNHDYAPKNTDGLRQDTTASTLYCWAAKNANKDDDDQPQVMSLGLWARNQSPPTAGLVRSLLLVLMLLYIVWHWPRSKNVIRGYRRRRRHEYYEICGTALVVVIVVAVAGAALPVPHIFLS